MKNKNTFLIAFLIFLTLCLGCSWIPGGNSGGTQPSNSTDNVNAPIAKTGVAECDELVDLITRDMQSQKDDGYIASKAREFVVDWVKDSIKRSIEENQGDKQKIANDCRQIKQEYEKKQSNQNSNSQ